MRSNRLRDILQGYRNVYYTGPEPIVTANLIDTYPTSKNSTKVKRKNRSNLSDMDILGIFLLIAGITALFCLFYVIGLTPFLYPHVITHPKYPTVEAVQFSIKDPDAYILTKYEIRVTAFDGVKQQKADSDGIVYFSYLGWKNNLPIEVYNDGVQCVFSLGPVAPAVANAPRMVDVVIKECHK